MATNLETDVNPRISGDNTTEHLKLEDLEKENLHNESEIQVLEKNMESKFKTEIKPKINAKEEDFEENDQPGMDLLGNLQNVIMKTCKSTSERCQRTSARKRP